MTEPWFEVAFGDHYPELYGHRDETEAQQCVELLPQLGPLSINGGPVLDLGCGDGRHLSFLNQLAVNVVGLDLSTHLLDRANRRPQKTALVRGDMRFLPFPDQTFDSILSLFTAFGYFGSLNENQGMVEQVSRTLAHGGHWFLDYFNCDLVLRELGSGKEFSRQRQSGGLQINETRRYIQSEGIVAKDVCLKQLPGSNSKMVFPSEGLQYTEKVAVFGLDQIDDLAGANRFKRVASAGSYDGASLEQGDRWILVYQKG